MLGLQLVDTDVSNIPMIAADPYGNFIPGPLRGLPQYVTAHRPRRGQPHHPGSRPGECASYRHRVPERHRAQRRPRRSPRPKRPMPTPSPAEPRPPVPAGSYDNELLDLHFICGDGRCNENIALTAVHQIFHSEHDRLVDYIKNVLLTGHERHHAACRLADALGAPDAERHLERRAPLPGRPLRHRDGVPAPGVRGVRPQGAARDQPLRAVRLQPDGRQPGDHGRVRPRRLPLRPLDADRHDPPAPTPDGSHNDIPLLDGFLNPAAYHDGGSAGAAHLAGGRRRHHHGHVRSDRQRDRRVRHRHAAQPPARPAARPAGAST